MNDVFCEVETAIHRALRELFPGQSEEIIPSVKVWFDYKKGILVSNVGMLLGKATKSKAEIVAVMLAVKL